MRIVATTNRTKDGFSIRSEYNKLRFKDWLKKYTHFEIIPIIKESENSRGYLEGAIIPEYCKWQYGMTKKDSTHEQMRYVFKHDFSFEIKRSRDGTPKRVPKSSKGIVKELIDKYTKWADENGAPVPNPELYKLWRDKWQSDRFPTFQEFLDFLGIECDSMPSDQTLKKLESNPQL